MTIEVVEETATSLAEYAGITAAFEVREVLDVLDDAGGRLRLEPRPLAVPYVKDYDAIGETPAQWAERFDLSTWGFFSARSGVECVGRAAVARGPLPVEMFEGQNDLALLWDIRVAPAARRRGVGAALFESAVTWAASKGCRQLEIETQNVNVSACRFYARRGCSLRSVRRGAYPELPAEIQLIWSIDLLGDAPAGT
jgi:GNAT superfamily N-acetyltransferase